MPVVISILANTPVWVFALFAYLIWQGVMALRSRSLPVWRLMIVPCVFIIMGVSRAASGQSEGAWPLIGWLAGAAALLPFGLITGPHLASLDRANAMVVRQGSPVPLCRNLTVFTLQYGAAVVTALNPDSHTMAAIVARAVSGASAGYFIGWALAFWRQYRNAGEGPVPA